MHCMACDNGSQRVSLPPVFSHGVLFVRVYMYIGVPSVVRDEEASVYVTGEWTSEQEISCQREIWIL